MKTLISLFALVLSLNVLASSGSGTLKIVLDQPEVETLEKDLASKGYTLSNIQDVYATRGVYPRCPCTSLEMTFSRPNAGKAEQKKFSVSTQGFGTSLQVTILPIK